jgi:8-oxo-dGTP pyrophosphatase MutT (NUDIX family)
MAEATTTASTLIPAATVIVLRDGPSGLEVLMLKRSGHGAFAGHWVFPGGKVDAADHGTVADHEDHLTPYRRAAVREAAEEAAIKLTTADLVTLSYWEPPATVPKRFGTWFFLTAAPAHAVEVDGHEIHDHDWLSPADILARRDAGEVELAPPTWMSLRHLSEFTDTAAALSAERPTQSAEARYSTHVSKVDGVLNMMWTGDAGYETSDASLPGERNRLVMADGAWRYERTLSGLTQ